MRTAERSCAQMAGASAAAGRAWQSAAVENWICRRPPSPHRRAGTGYARRRRRRPRGNVCARCRRHHHLVPLPKEVHQAGGGLVVGQRLRRRRVGVLLLDGAEEVVQRGAGGLERVGVGAVHIAAADGLGQQRRSVAIERHGEGVMLLLRGHGLPAPHRGIEGRGGSWSKEPHRAVRRIFVGLRWWGRNKGRIRSEEAVAAMAALGRPARRRAVKKRRGKRRRGRRAGDETVASAVPCRVLLLDGNIVSSYKYNIYIYIKFKI
jgi:hypothetical protein